MREDFALAETFFALAESFPALQIRPLTHFQPQLTHFQPQFTHFRHRQPPTKWQIITKLFFENLPDFTEKVVILRRK